MAHFANDLKVGDIVSVIVQFPDDQPDCRVVKLPVKKILEDCVELENGQRFFKVNGEEAPSKSFQPDSVIQFRISPTQIWDEIEYDNSIRERVNSLWCEVSNLSGIRTFRALEEIQELIGQIKKTVSDHPSVDWIDFLA